MCFSREKKIARLEKQVEKRRQEVKIAQLKDQITVLEKERDSFNQHRNSRASTYEARNNMKTHIKQRRDRRFNKKRSPRSQYGGKRYVQNKT